jgi:hypothetical protein
MMTREDWLHALLSRLRPQFDGSGIQLPDEVAVSCGWPSERARSARNRRIGECWRADCSGAGRPEIFISPTLADSIEVGHVLVHELIHAALPDAGHRAPFKRAATKLGLTGKMTATIPTDELRRQLEELVGEIGEPYPHALLDPRSNERKQSTRLLKLECPGCGYVIRTTQKWIEVGMPTCCCGEEFEAGE